MTVWRQAQRYEVPCIAFINKLDKPNSDLEMTLKSMKNKLGKEVILTQIPLKDQPLNGKWTLLTSIQFGRKIIFLPICFLYERARFPKSKIKPFYPRCKCHSHTHFQDDQTKNCKYFLKRVRFRLKLECVCNKAFLLKNIKVLFFTIIDILQKQIHISQNFFVFWLLPWSLAALLRPAASPSISLLAASILCLNLLYSCWARAGNLLKIRENEFWIEF